MNKVRSKPTFCGLITATAVLLCGPLSGSPSGETPPAAKPHQTKRSSAPARSAPGTTGRPGSESPAGSKSAQIKDQAGDLFRRGQEHYFKRNFHTAAELFKRAVELEPEHALGHAYLGDVYLVQKEPDLAIKHIRVAIELSSEPAREWFRLGQALFLKKDAEGSLKAYARALSVDPQLHEVHFETGTVHLYLLKDPKATVRDWTAFRKAAPDDPQGPAIDRAIRLLQDPSFKLPSSNSEPCLPGTSDSRVPDIRPKPTKSKEENTPKEVIPVEEL